MKGSVRLLKVKKWLTNSSQEHFVELGHLSRTKRIDALKEYGIDAPDLFVYLENVSGIFMTEFCCRCAFSVQTEAIC